MCACTRISLFGRLPWILGLRISPGTGPRAARGLDRIYMMSGYITDRGLVLLRANGVGCRGIGGL